MNSTKSRSDFRLKFEKVHFIMKKISKEFQILLNCASNLAYIVAPTQQNCCHPKLISKTFKWAANHRQLQGQRKLKKLSKLSKQSYITTKRNVDERNEENHRIGSHRQGPVKSAAWQQQQQTDRQTDRRTNGQTDSPSASERVGPEKLSLCVRVCARRPKWRQIVNKRKFLVKSKVRWKLHEQTSEGSSRNVIKINPKKCHKLKAKNYIKKERERRAQRKATNGGSNSQNFSSAQTDEQSNTHK